MKRQNIAKLEELTQYIKGTDSIYYPSFCCIEYIKLTHKQGMLPVQKNTTKKLNR